MRNMRNISDFAYKHKFGRDKKVRSISEIHNLYINSRKRSDFKQIVILGIIDEIVEKIPLTTTGRGRGQHITYFTGRDNVLYQYEMSYNSEWDSYGTSYNRVKFEGSVEQIRDQKLDFLLSNEMAFELGEKYNRNKNYNMHLHHRVKYYLVEAITKQLEIIYKEINFLDIPKVIPVSIDECQYIFTLDGNSSGYYKKFVLVGEVGMKPIEM
jgi:hypothetical protein